MKKPNITFKVSACLLIALFLTNYLTFGFFGIISSNVYIEFFVWTILSVGAFVMSILTICIEKKFASGTLTLFLSGFFILFTIFAFLLPEAGIPPLIQF